MPDMPENGSKRSVLDRSPFPREHLVRFLSLSSGSPHTGLAVRAAATPGDDVEPSANASGMPTLYGYFTPFNRWTEIDSFWEGHFMERIAPGAFRKTFREQTPKVLFQHGMDLQVGDKPLGAPSTLREEDFGPYYEVPLLDTSYNRDLVPGLEEGLYGASFRFTVMREEYVEEPGSSDHNPAGLPERTIKEVRCAEFGPVTFPAYPDATAGVRSLTDEFIVGRAAHDPDRLRGLLEYLERRDRSARPRPSKVTTQPVLAGISDTTGRMDSEDAGTLAQMLALASSYVDEQDETDEAEAANITAMQAIQAGIIDLLNVEAAENEPDEPDEDERSAPASAPSTGDAGTRSHLTDERRKTPPVALTGGERTHLYGTRRKETEPWRL